MAICTTGTRPRTTGCRVPRAVRQGLDRVLPRLPGPRARRRPTGRSSTFQKYSEDDLMKDVFEDGYVDVGDLPADLPEGVVQGGFNTTERNALMGEKLPGQVHRQHAAGTRARATRASRQLRRNVERYGSKGVKLYTRRVERDGSRGLEARPTRRPTATWRHARSSGIKNIHVHKGPTIWPLDKDAFDVVRRRPRRHRLPGAELHRRARRPAADRGLLLHGDAGAQRVRGPGRGHRRA